MEVTGVGGGIMLAIAAVLWLAYLLPNWWKRREYLATERNAVRLQQTIRVLAETAQVPDVVKVARSAPFPVAVGRPATPQPVLDPRVLTARRIRRTRALTSLVLVSSVLLGVIQISLIASTGAALGSWFVLAVCGVLGFSSLAMLGRLAERSQQRPAVERPARRTSLGAPARVAQQPQPAVDRSWTPVTVPKPLYLSRPDAPATVPAVDLEHAAAVAEQARRAAEQEAASLQP
ncbi:MAG TPA: hypothetical protein VN200_07375, partial [Rhodoglobus sp.]|nr:hypothetical protein [Rhodoglobus sp.]